jgi:hypothetical protein
MINKSTQSYDQLEMRLLSHQGSIYMPNQKNIQLQPEELQDGTFFIELPKTSWKGKKIKLEIGFYDQDELVETAHTLFLGPRTYY